MVSIKKTIRNFPFMILFKLKDFTTRINGHHQPKEQNVTVIRPKQMCKLNKYLKKPNV